MAKNQPLIYFEDFITDETGNDFKEVMERYTVSSICIHDKFFAIGTRNGKVCIFDHIGNLYKSISLSKYTIKNIDIDLSGNYMAISDSLPQITVYNISSLKKDYIIEIDRAATAIAINPNYHLNNEPTVMYAANDAVSIYNRSKISARNSNILINQGNVLAIRWNSNFVAWANHMCVNVFYINKDLTKPIGYMRFKELLSKEDSFASLAWMSNFLLVASRLNIKICSVVNRDHTSSQKLLPNDSQGYTVELIQNISLDEQYSGAFFIKKNLICVNIFLKEALGSDKREYGIKIKVFEMSESVFVERGVETTSVTSKHDLRLISMSSLENDLFGFLAFPKNLFKIRVRSLDDIIKCLLEDESYQEAYEKVKDNSKFTSFSLKTVGIKYADWCLSKGDYNAAALIFKDCLKNDTVSWEKAINEFIKTDQIDKIIQHIPSSSQSFLQPTIYDNILINLISKSPSLLTECLIKWPKTLYNGKVILDHINNMPPYQVTGDLLKAKATLYVQLNDFINGFHILLRLKDQKIFEHISQHGLFKEASEHLGTLILINETDSLKILTTYGKYFQVPTIVNALRDNEKLLFTYLDKLYNENPSLVKPFIDLLIELSGKYSKSNLINLFQNSTNYDILKARKMCKSMELYREFCYLSETIGKDKSVLKTLIHHMENVNEAVCYCNKKNEKMLWEYLQSLCIKDPSKISELLVNQHHQLDTLILIRSIPENIEVNNLKETLSKLLYDSNTKLSLMKCCRKILEYDNWKLLQNFGCTMKQGCPININTTCLCCFENIVIRDNIIERQDTVIFLCKHVFHSHCLSNKIGRDDICIICSITTRYLSYQGTSGIDIS